ncbi:PASTA domain-containing protein [Spirillospora sp. CA-253888]
MYKRLAGPILLAVLATACSSGPELSTKQTPAPPSAPPTTAPSAPSAPETPSTPATAPVAKAKVPNVVGKNHQQAQNDLQAAGFFALTEEDATGQGRMLVWDRSWVVVRQSPRAGTKASTNTTITLSSKKIGE